MFDKPVKTITAKKIMDKILFLCTGNSCRSQMAEGWANHLHNNIKAYSAGTKKQTVNPYAIEVMKEVGVDISHHYAKDIDEIKDINFELIVTVCDNVKENCPLFSGPGRMVHQGFADPPELAAKESEEEKIKNHYRKVRDEIKQFITHELSGLIKK